MPPEQPSNDQPEPQQPVNNYEEPQAQPQAQTQPLPQPETQPQPQFQTPPAPVAAPEYTPQQPMPTQRPAEDPGKLFSILGLVCAFIFLQLPGLILSIIGLRKSKKAGYPTTLGSVGIVLNSIFMVVSVGALAAITLVAYNGIQDRVENQASLSAAQSITKKAEVFYMTNNHYPTIDELRSSTTDGAKLSSEEGAALVDTAEPSGNQVGYQLCKDAAGETSGVTLYTYSSDTSNVAIAATAGECAEPIQ
jgi:Tfp pilus assembly protein PilE